MKSVNKLIRIKRYNLQHDPVHWEESFQVPCGERATVLQVLQYIYEKLDPTLAFEYSCRCGRCGRCGVEVNGCPSLACTTFIREDEITLSPLSNLPLIRDLVASRSNLELLLKEEKIYFTGGSISDDRHSKNEDMVLFKKIKPPEELSALSNCLECLCCHAACPGIALHDGNLYRFAGPFVFLKLAQLAMHPLERKNWKKLSLKLGLEYCLNCRRCQCPQGIPIYRLAIEPYIL